MNASRHLHCHLPIIAHISLTQINILVHQVHFMICFHQEVLLPTTVRCAYFDYNVYPYCKYYAAKSERSFIYCVRPTQPCFQLCQEIQGLGPYVRHAELLHRNQHVFEVGRRHKVYQKAISLGVQLWSSTHDTVVYWIQNAAGAQTWPIGEKSVRQLLDSFTP